LLFDAITLCKLFMVQDKS